MSLCFLILIIAIPVLFWLWHIHFQRAEEILQGWAAQNGLTILNSLRQNWSAGPYTWRRVRGQEVFRVEVKDQKTGQVRSGWVKVGSFWGGTYFSSHAEVTWDSE